MSLRACAVEKSAKGRMADELPIVPQSPPPPMVNEQSAQEDASIPQSTSSTSAYFQYQADTGISSTPPLVDVVRVGTRTLSASEVICSDTDSDDQDNSATEQDQVRELPNLAAAALQRLASGVQHLDDSANDDFRPLKKRRRVQQTENATASDSENENEVSSLSFFLLTNHLISP